MRLDDDHGDNQRKRRTTVPGGTAREINLSNSAERPIYRLLVCHVQGKASHTAPVLFEEHGVASRYAAVTRCPDCPGVPVQAPSAPPGFRQAVIIEHDPSCPSMRAALGQAGGQP